VGGETINRPLPAGRIDVSMLLSGTTLNAGHTVDADQFEPGKPIDEQAHSHDLDLSLANLSLNVQVGLGERLGLAIFVPVRMVFIDAHFHDADGDAIDSYESIHHRTETISGLGDIRLSGRYRALEGRAAGTWTLDLRAGFTIPTGSIEDDPFALGRGGMVHQHIFFGDGTFDPTAGFEASRSLGMWRVQTFGSARVPLYDNKYRYRGPSMFAAGAGISRGIGASGVRVIAQVSGFHEVAARWADQAAKNSGRTDLIGLIGGAFRLTPNIGLLTLIRMPYLLQSQGGQLALSPTLVLGLTMSGQAW